MRNIFTLQKLFLCFVFFISTISVVHAQNIVHIPDANFKKALVDNLNINTNGDNEIQVSEAESYAQMIDVSELGITDLTGIEAFTAMFFLKCSDNQLTTLNVENNIALEILDCSNNNLSILDVSENHFLTYLGCKNNNLSNLDVSKNTALNMLVCSNNSLSSLNIQNGKNTTFALKDFSNNPNLTCIQVDDVDYANEHFTQKDAVAGYSTNCEIVYIPDANFKSYLTSIYIGIDLNEDNEIQVSEAESYAGTIYVGSNNIIDLTGIEAFVNLTVLECYGNNLSSIDLSKNTGLTYLDCSNNNLSSIDLSKNTGLTYLDCYGNNLSSVDLSKNTSLIYLYCENNSLSSLDVSQNVALKELYCSDNNLSSLNIQNGNSNYFSYHDFTGNPALTCIQVDDVGFANKYYIEKDAWAEYSTDCNPTTSLKNGLPHISNIYPNPATSMLTIETTEKILSKEVIGLDGLVKLEDRSSKNTLDVSTIPSGVYFISIKTQGGVYQDKFVKQ